MRKVVIHMMDYVDVATTNVLSPDILSAEYLRNMLKHLESELPSMMHLPISSDNTLHFYQYLSTHVPITDRQFLLCIDVPIQNRALQLQIYIIFSLPVNHKYIGITYDETKAVAVIEPVSMPMDSFAG